MKNSMLNICTCRLHSTQIWTTLSVLTKTKNNPNPNPITFLKFLELIMGKCTRRRKYKVQTVTTVIAHTVLQTIPKRVGFCVSV